MNKNPQPPKPDFAIPIKKFKDWQESATLYAEIGMVEEAIKCLEKAIEIDEEISAWHNKGIALSKLNLNLEAMACFDMALEMFPERDDILNNKGNALVSLERYEDAIKCYDEALRVNPDQEEARDNKGLVLLIMGRGR